VGLVTILVAYSAYWPIPTIGVLLKVAAHVDEIENLWFSSLRVVGAEKVLPSAISVTVPIFSAVEGVGEVTISSSVTIKGMTTVLCSCRCCASGWGRTHFRIQAWS